MDRDQCYFLQLSNADNLHLESYKDNLHDELYKDNLHEELYAGGSKVSCFMLMQSK